MGYREEFFKNNKPEQNGKYRCAICGKYFKKEDIDVDHRIPKRNGGTDDLWNLQATCRHCNRSKRDRQTRGENISTILRATANGGLLKLTRSVMIQKIKDMLGFKYRR